ncbi:NAD(P)-binding domain-containing protein [Algoriphagus boritolerans]|uniref:NAD(P)-binding domain-containing protein n=1 Tax=Algoriphagus boritolerans TaxID=308111 RepID=UPI000A3FA2D7
MTTVSIIGLGWIGEPLGIHLQEKGFQVLGSTTSAEKLEHLSKKRTEGHSFFPQSPS